jgi:serine/threonine protein kinase
LKLCDFGWAAYVSNCSRRTYCGTTDYLSPELLNDEKYGKEVDVWSIGVLAYELCTGKAPFASKQDKDTRKKITKLDFSIPSNFSRELRDFVEGILKKNPEKRPTIEEVLNHRWLKMNVSAYRESQKQKPQNLSYFN